MERTKKVAYLLCAIFLCAVIIFFTEAAPLRAAGAFKIPPDVQRIMDVGPRTPAETALLEAASLRLHQLVKNNRPKVIKCGLGIAGDVYSYWNSYTPQEKDFILSTAQRPQLDTSIVSPSGRFRIHYDTAGSDAPDPTDNNHNGIPDYIDAVAQICDSSYNEEISILKYSSPPGDGNRGGDSLYDIYVSDLFDLNGRYYGLTWPDYDDTTDPGDTIHPHLSSSIDIDNTFGADKGYPTSGVDAARVTLAHEFFHVIQIGDYGIWKAPFVDECDASGRFANRYFFEMSTVWMETVVYPGIPDYLQYLPWLFANITPDFQ